MAKAGLLFAGTDDGVVLFSNPGAVGRWLRIGQELRAHMIRAVWALVDHPLVVFACTAGAGLQRSDDGGQHWRQTLDEPLSTVVGHPRTPRLLYLGAADGRVYRSIDAGVRWERCAPVPQPAGAAAYLAVAFEDPQRLYVGSGAHVWASADAGDHWEPYGTGLPWGLAALAASPTEPGLLYAIVEGALYRCAGAGERWEQIAVQYAPLAAITVLAGKAPVLLAGGAGLVRSTDQGATWQPVDVDTAWNGPVTALATAPYHIDTAFVGTAGGQLASSADRGRTWQLLRQDLPPLRCIAAARLA